MIRTRLAAIALIGAFLFLTAAAPPSCGSRLRADQWGRLHVGPERARPVALPTSGSTACGSTTRGGLVRRAKPVPLTGTVGLRRVRDPVRAHGRWRRGDPPARGYAYMPIVAGGTSFMYNLKIGGARSPTCGCPATVIAKIFTGVITKWNDPAITADNPGLSLPARRIVPVVRSDGSGTTAQFTTWMSQEYPGLWNAYCAKADRKSTPCGVTSNFPVTARLRRPERVARGLRIRGPGAERGHHHLRRVLVRAQRGLPGREGAQQGRLLRRADPAVRRGGPAQARRSTMTRVLARVPHPDPRRRLQQPRPPGISAVQLQLHDRPDQARDGLHHGQGRHPGATSPTTSSVKASSERPSSATRRCRSTSCRRASSRCRGSPAWCRRT